MPPSQNPDSEQAALWNGTAGQAWVDLQALMDSVLAPFEKLLVDAAVRAGAMRVLDVGCGTGGTTLAIAGALGPQAHCTGIDLSAPMISAARDRASTHAAAADFICADAQMHAFAPASFDRIVSRFGVMFFDDPTAAFNTLRRAARPGAGLHVISWRDAAENPFMTVAERAAAPLLPAIPPRQPDAPGQFAFADRRRVHRLLDAAGWQAIDIQPVDLACTLPTHELERYFTRLGPLGRVLHEADPALRGRIVDVVRAAFQPYVDGETVRFTAACWSVVAQAPAM